MGANQMKQASVSRFSSTQTPRASFLFLTAVTCLLLSCVFPAHAPCQAKADGKDYLRFEAEPLRPDTQVGEPIYLRFRLTNVSTTPVLVNRHLRLFDIVELQIAGPSGQRVKWCGRIPQIVDTPGAFVTLAPGARI